MADSDLTHEADRRKDPDSDRQGAFKRGWTEADKTEKSGDVAMKYSENPGLEDLTWDNLGYRLGILFGETSDELKQELFEWCVSQRRDS